MPQFLTLSTLCRTLNCNRSSVYRWIKQGMPFHDIGTTPKRRNYRFVLDEVIEWFAQRQK